MAMDRTAIKANRILAASLLLWVLPFGAHAAKWKITSGVSVSETYSDNINLAGLGLEQSDLVTEITPNIAVNARGARLSIDLSYKLETLFSSNRTDKNELNHQLIFSSSAELMPKTWFLDVTNSVRQINVDNTAGQALDNINGNGNRATSTATSLTSTTKHHLGTFADTLTTTRLTQTTTDDGAASDTTGYELNASITSGRRFTQWRWSGNFNLRENGVGNGADTTTFQTLTLSSSYRVAQHWSIQAIFTDQSNDFNGDNSANSGSNFSLGAVWQPSRRLSAQANLGDNNHSVAVSWNPSLRTSLQARYENNEVGINLGDTWELNFTHRLRRSSFSLNYEESTTTTQLVLLEPTLVLFNDENGQPVLAELNLPTLTDEVFIRQRLSADWSYTRSKTNIRALFSHETREFQVTDDDETSMSANLILGWKMLPKTNASLTGGWLNTESRQNNRDDDRFDLSARVTRNLTPYSRGEIEYRYTENQSNDATAEFEENRLSARLNMTF